MAINTKAKRRGAAGAGLLSGAYLPLPDHAVDAEDRRQLAGFYPRAPVSTYVVGTRLQDAATASGNGVTIDVSNHPAVLVEVAGLTSATIFWEGSGSSGIVRATSAIEATTHLPMVTAVRDGLYIVNCLDTLRARIASYVSGTITITVRESLSYPDANLLALSTIQSAQISSSVLPTGAATEATLAALNAKVGATSTAIFSGTAGATTSAALLPSHACNEVEVQSSTGSAATLLVGQSGQEVIELQPGDSRILQVANTNLISFKTAASTATINWLARS